MAICIYGTVYNNVFSVEDSIKSVFDPNYNIVITDSFSTDGTWEKLQELKKEYNLTLLRLKSSRGKGRDYALKHCPPNSLTAYIDLDVIYNLNFHKIISKEIDGVLILGSQLSFIGRKEKVGHWSDLNYGEDIEFLSRQDIKITVPSIIGKDSRTELGFIEREKIRYSTSSVVYIKRIIKNVIDLYRGCAFSPRDLISIYSYVVKYRPVLVMAYALSRMLGHYKNLEPNNYVGLWKKALETLTDPTIFSISKDFFPWCFPKPLYSYLKSYIPEIDFIITSKIPYLRRIETQNAVCFITS